MIKTKIFRIADGDYSSLNKKLNYMQRRGQKIISVAPVGKLFGTFDLLVVFRAKKQ